MTDTITPTIPRQIVSALAGRYRRDGYHRVDVPAVVLLGVAAREELEYALGALLDAGSVVPVGRSGVALHPSARIALLSRAVLEQWMEKVSRETGYTMSLYRDAIAAELSRLTQWAATAPIPEELAQRAAELAGVLTTIDLDPKAMDVVARHGGTAHRRLAALAAARPRSSSTLGQLVDHLRNAVSTDNGATDNAAAGGRPVA